METSLLWKPVFFHQSHLSTQEVGMQIPAHQCGKNWQEAGGAEFLLLEVRGQETALLKV